MSERPAPRRAVVVGGSEGIGLAIAQRLVAAGADVVIASRSQTKLTEAVSQIGADRQREEQVVASRTMDVTSPADVSAAIGDIVAAYGVPDLLVNTAGYARPGWLGDIPDQDVRGMVEVNLLGTINVCRAIMPHMQETGAGQIVTTSSLAGLAGIFGYTIYSATKFGVIGFSEALRRELRPSGVDVKVLCPPNTLTPGFDEESNYKPAEVLAAEEKAATLSPEEVADALVRGLRRRKFLIVPKGSKVAAAALRFLPPVAEMALRRP